MFQIIRHDTNFPFTRYLKPAALLSLALLVVSAIAMASRGGLKYGIDFAGGTVVEVNFKKPVDIGAARAALADAGLAGAEIKHFGSDSEVLVSTEMSTTSLEGLEGKVHQGLDAKFGADAYSVVRIEMVGPKVITNMGTTTDTFDLTFAGNDPDWVVSLPATSVTLASGESTVVIIYVTLPLDALAGESDSVTITATSQGDPSKSASAILITRTINFYFPVIRR